MSDASNVKGAKARGALVVLKGVEDFLGTQKQEGEVNMIKAQAAKTVEVASLIVRGITGEFSDANIPDKFLNSGSLTYLANYLLRGQKIVNSETDEVGTTVTTENTGLMKIGDNLWRHKVTEDNAWRLKDRNKPVIDQNNRKNYQNR